VPFAEERGTVRAVGAYWRSRLARLAAHQGFTQLDYGLCAEKFYIVENFRKETLCLTKLETSGSPVNPQNPTYLHASNSPQVL
jgi:hypothetical protein